MSFNFKYQLWFFSIIAITFFSCGKDSACFKGTGKIVEEQRVISSDVTMIRTQNNIDIVITQSNEASLTIEGGENLLPYINTDVSGTEITISSDNKCSMFRDYSIPITAYLSLPNITKINYTGQGNITSTNTLNLTSLDIESSGGTGSINLNLNVNDFSVGQHSGPADFTFTGSVKNARVYTLGSGWFYLQDFISEKLEVNHSGIGDVILNVTDRLDIGLQSHGNINYYGNPTVIIYTHTGSGQIIKK
ncbi:MAG: hypothetical protein COB15_03825 [Flavobacteriales bacterium]|nr:MAG: hypothetical protein COB15_03825 [Flavobacteriales bacterium]